MGPSRGVHETPFWEAKAYLGDEVREPQFEVPVQRLGPADLARPVPPGLRAWWLGHATVLLEIDGVRVLTDPILSHRASPFQFIGPARLHPAPLAMEDLKNIDAVVISHDHFDHLDMDTIQALARGGTHFYVGLGIGAHLERWGAPDLSLMKVGAYGDRWETIHMSPESAVRAHQDLGAKTLLPVHWATFNLAYHAWEEPIVRSVKAAQAQGVHIITPRPGEKFEAGAAFVNRGWYLKGQ